MSAITPTTCPGRTCGGLGSTCSFPAPPPTDQHLALDQLPWSVSGERGAAACAPAKRRPRSAVDPRGSRALPTLDHPVPARPIRAATTKQLTDHSDTSNRVRQRWLSAAPTYSGSSAVRTARLQRPRTPDACPSGHPDHTGRVDTRRMDTGRMDTGRADTGRPPDQLDGRPSAWRTADANRATNGVAGVRTSWTARRRRPPDGQPKLARVAASAALGNPITPPQ
jgi:hypothetical protein